MLPREADAADAVTHHLAKETGKILPRLVINRDPGIGVRFVSGGMHASVELDVFASIEAGIVAAQFFENFPPVGGTGTCRMDKTGMGHVIDQRIASVAQRGSARV